MLMTGQPQAVHTAGSEVRLQQPAGAAVFRVRKLLSVPEGVMNTFIRQTGRKPDRLRQTERQSKVLKHNIIIIQQL